MRCTVSIALIAIAAAAVMCGDAESGSRAEEQGVSTTEPTSPMPDIPRDAKSLVDLKV